MSDFVLNAGGDLELIGPDGFDGSVCPIPMRFQDILAAHRMTTVQEVMMAQDESTVNVVKADVNVPRFDSDSDGDEKVRPDRNSTLTRSELKKLDREIPWRKIVTFDNSTVDKYLEAAAKEVASFDKWAPIRPVSQELEATIRSDPRRARRVMKARCAYRDKNCGRGDLKAKARIVLSGFRDPDLRKLIRYAATASRLAFFMVLNVFVSSENWTLASADATAAFLQGKQSGRTEPVYMEPPRDPLLNKIGAFVHTLYEVVGNVYGLVNAPYEWSQEVARRLGEIGFVRHSLDTMTYLYRSGGQLLALCIIHVDDLLITYSPKFEVNKLHDAFEWGSWSYYPDVIVYCGQEIVFVNDYTLKVVQVDFLAATESKTIPLQRVRDSNQSLTVSETTEFKSVVGSLQWVSGRTRPDLCASTSLLQHAGLTIVDLKQAYTILDYARETKDTGIMITKVDLTKAAVVAYGDASWGNAEENRTQIGFLVCIVDGRRIDRDSVANVVDWKSSKSKRVVRSTLAAETQAVDDATDHGVFASAFLDEIVHGQRATAQQPLRTRLFSVTDCRSLYDAILKDVSQVTEKRTAIGIASVKESIIRGGLRWVPSHLQMADGMTKMKKALTDSFTKWLWAPIVKLGDGTVR